MTTALKPTYRDMLALLPSGAVWSSSFGNPGEGGYTEYHRTLNGDRWVISNGAYHLNAWEFVWTCRKDAATPARGYRAEGAR